MAAKTKAAAKPRKRATPAAARAKTGRPLKEIDPRQVEALARIGCTYMEMAAVLDCSDDTLKRRFADLIEKGREQGKASLRRKQFEVALAGDKTMLIWMGKQHLGQTDKQAHEVTGPEGGPLAVTVTRRIVHATSDTAPGADA